MLLRLPTVVVTYLGGYLLLVLLALCVATGLFYLAEVVEEHAKLLRRVLNFATLLVLTLHALLLVTESHPLRCLASSAAAHLAYATLLPAFPALRLLSPRVLLSAFLLVASTFLWGQHFWQDTYAPLEHAVGFAAVMLWFVPFWLGLALAGDGAALPTQTQPLGRSFSGDGARRSPRVSASRGETPFAFGTLRT